MKRRTTEQWHELIAEQTSSGPTAMAFCHERGLNPQYYGKRRKQLLNDAGVNATPAFVPVSVNRGPVAMTVHLTWGEALVLHIPETVSPAWLATLLQALRA